VLHLLVGQVAEPREDHHQVGRRQGLQPWNIAHIRVYRAVLWINCEQHGAFEAVMPGQNLAELRQRFLRAIFLVAADQHDVLALARPRAPLINDARGGEWRTDQQHANQQNAQNEFHGRLHVSQPTGRYGFLMATCHYGNIPRISLHAPQRSSDLVLRGPFRDAETAVIFGQFSIVMLRRLCHERRS
jgi:hypothetical protein